MLPDRVMFGSHACWITHISKTNYNGSTPKPAATLGWTHPARTLWEFDSRKLAEPGREKERSQRGNREKPDRKQRGTTEETKETKRNQRGNR